MSTLIKTPFGKLYITFSRKAHVFGPPEGCIIALERDADGEWLAWAGPFHAIFSPADRTRGRKVGG